MKFKQIAVLFLLALFLCGCEESFRVQALKWSGTGDYISVVSKDKVYFLEGEAPYTKSPIELEDLSSITISWSPLSNKLVYTTIVNRFWDLAIFDLNNQSSEFLTQDVAKDYYPRYLNSEEILFYSDRAGTVQPWRYLITSEQALLFEDRVPEVLAEGVSDDENNEISISAWKKGSLVQGLYKNKKWKWKEPLFKLKMPRWAPDNKRCLFVASNPDILKGDLLYLLDFENKESQWIPILPEQYLLLSNYFSKQNNWEKALQYDRDFLAYFPKNKKGALAYLQQIYYFFHVQPNRSKAKELLNALIQHFPKEESAVEAHFWLGVLLGIEKEFVLAKKEFQWVAEEDKSKKWKKDLNYFLDLLNKRSDKDVSYFFEGYRFKSNKNFNKAIQQYQHALFNLADSSGAEVVRLFLAQAYSKIGQRELAIKTLDKVCSLASEEKWKEKGRFEIASLLEQDPDQLESAAQVYLKVRSPYQEQALRNLFYLYRDKLFDFDLTKKSGDFFLKKYPESLYWDSIYKDLEELKAFFYQGILPENLSAYYQGVTLWDLKQTKKALQSFESALKRTKNRYLKRKIYQHLTELYQAENMDSVQSLAALFSYFLTFDAVSIGSKEWEEVISLLFQPTEQILSQSKGKALVRLCQNYLKEPAKNNFDLLVQALYVVGAFSEKEWKRVQEGADLFLTQSKAEELFEWHSLILVLAAASSEQAKQWDQALLYWNQIQDRKWVRVARDHVEKINQYRLVDPEGLRQFLWIKVISLSEIDFFQKEKDLIDEKLDSLIASKGTMRPLALLEKMALLSENRDENKEKRRLELVLLWQKLNQSYPGSEWEGRGMIQLSEFEEGDAFFILSAKGYQQVIERFSEQDLTRQATWSLGRLFLDVLDKKEEGLVLLNQVAHDSMNSEWKRKSLLHLARYYQPIDIEKSLSLYQQLVDNYPHSLEAQESLFALAYHYYQEREIAKALPLYEKLALNDLDPSDQLLVQERVALLKVGKKGLQLWDRVQKAITQGENKKVHKLFEKCLKLSQEEAFQQVILKQWERYCEEVQDLTLLPQIYQLKSSLSIDQEEWDRLIEGVAKNLDNFDWFELLEQWQEHQDLSEAQKMQVLVLRVKKLLQAEKFSEAGKVLQPYIQEREIAPDLLKLYFLLQHIRA